jgi:hypothetical protein
MVGQDAHLLATRASVLKKISGHVVSCNAWVALKFLESETPNLVVLCHSLSVEEAEGIADKAHRRDEGIRVLMLISPTSPDRSFGDTKFDAISLSGPAGLITKTAELLQGLPDHPS